MRIRFSHHNWSIASSGRLFIEAQCTAAAQCVRKAVCMQREFGMHCMLTTTYWMPGSALKVATRLPKGFLSSVLFGTFLKFKYDSSCVLDDAKRCAPFEDSFLLLVPPRKSGYLRGLRGVLVWNSHCESSQPPNDFEIRKESKSKRTSVFLLFGTKWRMMRSLYKQFGHSPSIIWTCGIETGG